MGKVLVDPVASCVIVDTTRRTKDFANPRWGVVTSDPVAILYEPRVVWQVDLHSKKGIEDYQRGLDWIYTARGDTSGKPRVTVVLDEAKHSAPTECEPLLARIVFSGMGNGIGVWAFSQTRYRVYPNLFSDAFHIIAFRVQSNIDRATLANDIGVPCDELRSLEDHAFLYWRQGMSAWTGPHKLPLAIVKKYSHA